MPISKLTKRQKRRKKTQKETVPCLKSQRIEQHLPPGGHFRTPNCLPLALTETNLIRRTHKTILPPEKSDSLNKTKELCELSQLRRIGAICNS